VDIEQLWSSKAVDTAAVVSETASIETVHSAVPVMEATPMTTVDRLLPALEPVPVDAANSTVPEAAPVLLPKEVSKPKAEVVHNEADSSRSTTGKHDVRKRHITVQSQKRKRWDSTSEDTDSHKYSSSSKRSKKNTHRRSSRRKSPVRHETASSSRKGERDRRTSESSGVKSDPPSRRIVSGFKGGSLQITILRGQQSLWSIIFFPEKGLENVLYFQTLFKERIMTTYPEIIRFDCVISLLVQLLRRLISAIYVC